MDERVFEKIQRYGREIDQNKIKNAFDYVIKSYEDTEGDISQVMEVLEILLPLKPDEDTIIAIILYDLYLSGFLNDERLKEVFGESVLSLLRTLTKFASLNYAENDKSFQVEVLRKMFLAMAKDLRVILIWLAQRLSKMQHLDDSDQSIKRIAKETMDLYVPIASRLGVYRIKIQLEDLAFQYLDPIEYKKISDDIEKFGEIRKHAIQEIKKNLKNFLAEKGIKAEIDGRFKSVYSIYIKLKKKGMTSVDQLYDLFAMRVILPSKVDNEGRELVDHLYSVLGLIHSEWRPISSRFKDYIAVPKPNGYRSLHTVVLGLGPEDMDQPVEIQVRDMNMHKEAEYGVASHWLYKGQISPEQLDTQSQWIQSLATIHESIYNESDIVQDVELDILKDRIFVLTPRGEVKDLPQGATPVDFAYAVHTDVGNRCVMAKVNGSPVALDSELKNGAVVEIITRKDATPKLRWLSIVKSGFAKQKIKAWFSSLNRENNLKEGRRLLNSQLERIEKPKLDQNYSILKEYCGQSLTLTQREALVEEVGKGSKIASDVVKKIYPYERNLTTENVVSRAEPQVQNLVLEEQVVVGGEEGLPIKMANCCHPKMRDKIVGYVTRGNSITIHNTQCKLLDKLSKERFIYADWKGLNSNQGKYRIGVKVTCISRVGLIHDITSVITKFGINIVDVMIKKAGSGLYNDCFLLDFDNLSQFDLLIDKLEEIKGVVKVTKENGFDAS